MMSSFIENKQNNSSPTPKSLILSIPTLLPLPGDRSLILKVSFAAREQAVQGVQSLLLRLLASIPPGKMRFTFFDPLGLGQNVAAFMHLADYDEKLVTARAWSESRHIEERLMEITEHIETVIQKYLRTEFATIEEYNQYAGEIAEPYRALVIFDFPTNFSDETIRRLEGIVRNGPRCGVYTIIVMNTEKPFPYGINSSELEQTCITFTWKDEHFLWEDEDFKDFILELDRPPSTEMFHHIIKSVGERAKEASKVEVPFERILLSRELWWQESSAQGFVLPLGPTGARRVQNLELGKGTSQHVLIGGKTGSGKSTLLHVMITTLAMRYSPDEAQVYLVDFKKGVEFKPYAIYKLPHARVVAIESEREFGVSVLQGLDTELKRRGDLFRASLVDHIADYRERTGQKMPRILLIVDEFQEFFSEDDSFASQAEQILDRLVRQGRAFGIHIILGSQTLAGSYNLARSTIEQMAVRIVLQCSEADSRLILADDNPVARLLSRPGEAIYNDANGLVEGNHPFQVALLNNDKQNKILHDISTLAEEEKRYHKRQQPIVFEGNAPANIKDNRALSDLLNTSGWPIGLRRFTTWLGEPVAIAEPIAASFRRQSASNLLIISQQDEQVAGMLVSALIGLATQHAPTSKIKQENSAQFFFLDFSGVDTSYVEIWPYLAEVFPHPFHFGRRRQLTDTIQQIAVEVEQRLENELDVTQQLEIYLTIFGLQRARDLRTEEDFSFTSFGEDDPGVPNTRKQLATIIRDGSDVGIHTLVWCDTYTNLTRTLDRRTLHEFDMRVVFQMNAEDSTNLIDSPAASKLGPYRALFYSDEEGRVEKFRPYGLPEKQWFGLVQSLFSEKSSKI